MKTSAVGVRKAAKIANTTIACLRYCTNNGLSINPSFAKKYAIIGISNKIPSSSESTSKVEIYDFNAI